VRLHIGGLPAKISEKDIEDRFRSFGTVQKVDLIPHPFEGKARLLYYDFK
jgi:RNA recognition motif-containing protein